MATYDSSIADVIKSAIRDAQDLVRCEIALAKAEAREEARRLGAGAALLAGAALAGIAGLIFLFTALAWALAAGFGWPIWAGFGVVTLVLMVMAGALAYAGWNRLRREHHMPLTTETVKESMQWMRARTS